MYKGWTYLIFGNCVIVVLNWESVADYDIFTKLPMLYIYFGAGAVGVPVTSRYGTGSIKIIQFVAALALVSITI
jgi:hypothetical protein